MFTHDINIKDKNSKKNVLPFSWGKFPIHVHSQTFRNYHKVCNSLTSSNQPPTDLTMVFINNSDKPSNSTSCIED